MCLAEIDDTLSGKSDQWTVNENTRALFAEIESRCTTKDWKSRRENYRMVKAASDHLALLFRICVELYGQCCDKIRSTSLPLTLALSMFDTPKPLARQLVEKHNELSVLLALAEFLENSYLHFPPLPSWLTNYMLRVQEEISNSLGWPWVPPIYRTDLCSHKELLPEDVEKFGRGYIAYWREWQRCHRAGPTPGPSIVRAKTLLDRDTKDYVNGVRMIVDRAFRCLLEEGDVLPKSYKTWKRRSRQKTTTERRPSGASNAL